MVRKLSRIALIVGVPAVIALSLLPQEVLPETGTWDKLNHVVAYAALTVAGGLGFKGWRPLLVVGLGLLILGGGLEVAQAVLPSRSASELDALANLVGVLVGSIAASGVNNPYETAHRAERPLTIRLLRSPP